MRYLVPSLTLAVLILSSPCLAQTWTQIQTTNAPSPRWEHAMSYDFISGRTVLFGGRPQSGAFLSDTWEYDGKNWTQVTTTTSPPGRYLSEMVYVRGGLHSLLFGGRGPGNKDLNDTWVYSSIKKTWTNVTPATSPPARYNPGLAYDSHRNVVVLFGGSGNRSDTWEWDGSKWTQMKPTTSPPGRYTAMTYDPTRKRVVLYGGSNRANDTWEYDGKTWTQVITKNKPTAYCCVAMAYDLPRQRVVIFGGFSPNNNETWEYDGNNWTQIKPPMSPSARRDFDNMVYDSRRQRMVLFGGLTNGGQAADTWEYVGTLPLTASPATISIATGGTQTFTLNAGSQHGSRPYWLFGSLTGTSPGVTLISAVGAVTIPLVPDFYTTITIAQPNTAFLVNTKGALNASGQAQASLVVPKINDQNAIGVTFYHAYLVYDTSNNFHLASNP
ncbi:MAG: Kelch repeat-containing protein, partial [Planctomycetota bacterium]